MAHDSRRAAVAALIAIGLPLAASRAQAQRLHDGQARTPPMGWNTWNKFGCDVSERLIRETADAIVASGMRDAGYRYVVIDDCWQVYRDTSGAIVADPQRFPNGIRALADYVHAKGLLFGIYTDAGTNTCQGRPGTLSHEEQDARTYDGQIHPGHERHGLDAGEGVARGVRMQGGQRAIVAGIHGLEHVQRLAAAALAHHNALRAHAQRVAHAIADGDFALALDIGLLGL